MSPEEALMQAEYGPRVIRPRVWVMFDNHTFRFITGSVREMGYQIAKAMDDDHHCASVACYEMPDGIITFMFHGDYHNPANTYRRLADFLDCYKVRYGTE